MDDGARQSLPYPLACLCPCRADALLEGSQKSALRSSECKVLLTVSCHHEVGVLGIVYVPWQMASPASVAFFSICHLKSIPVSLMSSFRFTDEGLGCQLAKGQASVRLDAPRRSGVQQPQT